MHPAIEHLVADFSGLFFAPSVNIVSAKLGIKPFDRLAPFGKMGFGKYLRR